MPMRRAPGTSCLINSIWRAAGKWPMTPATLVPDGAMEEISPASTGSSTPTKITGIRCVASTAARAAVRPTAMMTSDRSLTNLRAPRRAASSPAPALANWMRRPLPSARPPAFMASRTASRTVTADCSGPAPRIETSFCCAAAGNASTAQSANKGAIMARSLDTENSVAGLPDERPGPSPGRQAKARFDLLGAG